MKKQLIANNDRIRTGFLFGTPIWSTCIGIPFSGGWFLVLLCFEDFPALATLGGKVSATSTIKSSTVCSNIYAKSELLQYIATQFSEI